jgi:hypothetical protein
MSAVSRYQRRSLSGPCGGVPSSPVTRPAGAHQRAREGWGGAVEQRSKQGGWSEEDEGGGGGGSAEMWVDNPLAAAHKGNAKIGFAAYARRGPCGCGQNDVGLAAPRAPHAGNVACRSAGVHARVRARVQAGTGTGRIGPQGCLRPCLGPGSGTSMNRSWGFAAAQWSCRVQDCRAHLKLVHVVDDVAVALEDARPVELAVGEEEPVVHREPIPQHLKAADLEHVAFDALVHDLQRLRKPAAEVAALPRGHDGRGLAAALARELEPVVVQRQASATASCPEGHEAADLGARGVADEDAVLDGRDALQDQPLDRPHVNQESGDVRGVQWLFGHLLAQYGSVWLERLERLEMLVKMLIVAIHRNVDAFPIILHLSTILS